ncbi:unnamed protein product [Closterium sp. NIES-65]|nr:unnamed protein product [Closterium sp. NIES-65]
MSAVLTSAAVVEAEGEAQAAEGTQGQVRKGRGKSGGRQRVQRRKGGDGGEPEGEEAAGVRTNKLAWLADEGVMLDSEHAVAVGASTHCWRVAGGRGVMLDSEVSHVPWWDAVMRGGVLHGGRTLARVNRAIARCSSVKEALGVVEEMKAKGLNAANEGTYQALITVCRRQRQGERALVVYAAMKQAGMAPGMLTFNALISCCHQAQRFEDAFRLKADMEAQGLKPDVVTYTSPMATLTSHPHLLALLASHLQRPPLLSHPPAPMQADMEAQGLKPDVVTYTSLMALVVKTGPYRGRSSPSQRFERAMDLYREMRSPERAVQPDAITFNTLMFAAAQAKLPGKVLEVYGMMVADGVPPNQITFGILLEAVGSGGRLTAALQVFNEMRAAGIPPTTSTFNYLIDACATAPRPDAVKAWSLFSEMEAAENVRPNAETFNLLINACTKAGDHEGALKAFGMMRERGYTRAITTSTFNKLPRRCTPSPVRLASRYALPCTPCFQVRPPLYALLPGTPSPVRLASRYALPCTPCFQLYSQMRAEGHRPDVVTLGTLITACGKDGDAARAMAVRQELEAEGVPPNAAVFHALMAVQGRAGLWPAALGTFREMQGRAAEWEQKGSGSTTVIGGPRENPLAPTLPAYTVLFDACFGPEGADATIKGLVEKGCRLSLTPALLAAVEVYREAAEAGTFSHYALSDAYSASATAAPAPAAAAATAGASADDSLVRDLAIVTGMSRAKNQPIGEAPRGRFPKLFVSVDRTLQAVGLKGKSMRALTMQALSVDGQQLAQWLKKDAAAVFPELRK